MSSLLPNPKSRLSLSLSLLRVRNSKGPADSKRLDLFPTHEVSASVKKGRQLERRHIGGEPLADVEDRLAAALAVISMESKSQPWWAPVPSEVMLSLQMGAPMQGARPVEAPPLEVVVLGAHDAPRFQVRDPHRTPARVAQRHADFRVCPRLYHRPPSPRIECIHNCSDMYNYLLSPP